MSVLTREQRKRLGKLEHVPIAGEGVCPFSKGQVVEIRKGLTLMVTMVNRRRGGGWSIRYDLFDKRDIARLIKRTPAIHAADFEAIRESFDEFGYPPEPTAGVLHDAAQDSAYTNMPGAALVDAGEAVDEATQKRFTEEAKMADRLREQRRREKYGRRGTLERLAAAQAEAVARQVDISHHERVIADRVDRIERELGKGRAA